MGNVIDRWKRKGNKKQRGESNASEVAKLVERKLALQPPSLPAALRVHSIRVEEGGIDEAVFDDLQPDQSYVVNPAGVGSGDVLVAEPDPDGGPPTWTATPPPDLVITDGDPPASSPTPLVTGGPRWLAVNWDGVANADPVTYEVHISTSSGFTPSGSTLVGELRGTLLFVRNEPDDTPLEYGVTYYVKIVAKDDDGSAAASAQDSATLDPNVADDIAAGEITADKLETTLAISNLFVAGSPSAEHLELDSDGFRSFDSDGTTELINFPTDGSPNAFRGEVTAEAFTFNADTVAGTAITSINWDKSGVTRAQLTGWASGTDTASAVIMYSKKYQDYPTAWSAVQTRVNDTIAEVLAGIDVDGSNSHHMLIVDQDQKSSFLQIGASGSDPDVTKKYKMEFLSSTINIPSTAAHTGGGMNPTVTGVVDGDYIIPLGFAANGGLHRIFTMQFRNPSAAGANTVTLDYFNTSASVQDPSSQTFWFMVIHVA